MIHWELYRDRAQKRPSNLTISLAMAFEASIVADFDAAITYRPSNSTIVAHCKYGSE